MSRLTSRLERLERQRRMPFVEFDGPALAQRAAGAAALVGESGAALLATIVAAQEVARQEWEAAGQQGLAALTDRDLLLLGLVAWGWAIEDDPRLDGAFDAETRTRLNARLAIPGAGEAMRALDQATLDDLAGDHGPERQWWAAKRLGDV